jgi:hypothetical protein
VSRPEADVREQAERLLAAVLATAAQAMRGRRDTTALSDWLTAAQRLLAGDKGAVATGAAECCRCPLCRVIAALRDPSPEFAWRLATGASDLAVGLTTILRAVNDVLSAPHPQPAHPQPPPDPIKDPWHAATTAATEPG